MEFELTYYDVKVQQVSHNTTETLSPWFSFDFFV